MAKQSRLLSLLTDAPDIAISAQVVNELTNVLLQKFGYEAGHVLKIVEQIGQAIVVHPLTLDTSKKAIGIRQFIPKKQNLKELDEKVIAAVQENLNNRPRKSLGFLTPIEFYQAADKKTKSVAFET
ncbi:MAG: hypothetical protein ACKVU2_06985 [Saprospiraceae bacterium]